MNSRIIAAAAAIGIFAVAGPAAARSYTQDEALGEAVRNRPEISAAREQVLASRARIVAARSGTQAQVDVSAFARLSDNPLTAFADKLNTRTVTAEDFDPARLNDPGASDLIGTSLTLSYPLYTGGRVEADVQQAEDASRSAEHSLERGAENIAYEALRAYLMVQAAERAAAVVGDAAEAAARHARTTRRLVAEGRIIESDRLTAEVYLAGVQGRLEQANTRRDLALTELRRAMGLAPDADVSTTAWSESGRSPAQPLDVDALVDTALSQRRDLRALAAQIDAAGAGVERARAAFRPQVGLQAASSWYDDHPAVNNHSWEVMGVVRMNLYSGNLRASRVAESRHEVERLRAQLAAARQRVHAEVYAAAEQIRGALRRLNIALDHVATARRTVRLVDERYGQGRTLLIDLLQSERALLETRSEAVDAALALDGGRAALRYALGALAVDVPAPPQP
jgi:outer membrane protein TolC